jgi:hypothetical protein
MKKLRLLTTKDCNRKCRGCCNKQWDLDTLPTCTDFSGYEMIMVTGGEPMLYPNLTYEILKKLKKTVPETKIVLYTAMAIGAISMYFRFNVLDGLTLTLHNIKDIDAFIILDTELAWNIRNGLFPNKSLSLRLNVFQGIKLPPKLNCNWQIKRNIKWLKDCPLPEDEVFMKL